MKKITEQFFVAEQIEVDALSELAANGVKTIICNRPDHEAEGQPMGSEMREAAEALGMSFEHIPVTPGNYSQTDLDAFTAAINKAKDTAEGTVLAYCRTGNRSLSMWALANPEAMSKDVILSAAKNAGYDLSGLADRIVNVNSNVDVEAEAVAMQDAPVAAEETVSEPKADKPSPDKQYDVVIVGGGAGGVSVAASLLKRQPSLSIVIIDPAKEHSYQPGWTLVGGGVFRREDTRRPMNSVMPDGVDLVADAVTTFWPDHNCVETAGGKVFGYLSLVVSPGLKLNWEAIDGLPEALGRNGVTSNYSWDTAPFTWQNVQQLKRGKAIFTQPPMPIKCAGAPQKAMYLSCSEWQRQGLLDGIDVEFCNAGGVLFGVADYVPALMSYIDRYDIKLNLGQNLVKVDGDNKVATFEITDADGNKTRIEKEFDMLHVCPPQCALDFIKNSPLSDAAGWFDVHPDTLQHKQYDNIFGLGDGTNTPNAKTAAAVRAQAPVVAENVLSVLVKQSPRAIYDGYGSCPLTVERGKIVLAEFTYGGKLKPSFPTWLIDGTQPSYLAWLLKEKTLPWVYWQGMLKGHEWLVAPQISAQPPRQMQSV